MNEQLEELFGKHFNGMHWEDITKEMMMKFAEGYAKLKVEEEKQINSKLPLQNTDNCTCDNDRRYCKGCYADVTKDMFCFCGEFPLTKDATLSQKEYNDRNL